MGGASGLNLNAILSIILLTIRLLGAERVEQEWYVHYTLGKKYQECGEWERALSCYLTAYQHDPSHSEPLCKIATHYRLIGQNNLAYFFAKMGAEIGQRVLIDDIQPYQFIEELSIAGYYTPFKEEGFAAANALALRRDIPYSVKEQAYKNLLFYVEKIEAKRFLPITLQSPPIRNYNPMNPSIQKLDEGYLLLCRTVNYRQEYGHYQMLDGSPNIHIHTRNFLLRLSNDLQVLSQQEIVDTLSPKYPHLQVEGLEDCRLIMHDRKLWCTCTTWGAHAIHISLCRLAEPDLSSEIALQQFTPLQGPDPSRCEKNWLPFVMNHALHVIYSYDPFRIFKPDLVTGECASVLEYSPSCDFSYFRGSAAPIPFDDGYLMLVHEVVFNEWRVYLHRFLFLDKEFHITKASLPFIFQHLGVEYCCGMTIDHSGTQLIVPIGIEDREAYLCCINLDLVRSLLKSLPE